MILYYHHTLMLHHLYLVIFSLKSSHVLLSSYTNVTSPKLMILYYRHTLMLHHLNLWSNCIVINCCGKMILRIDCLLRNNCLLWNNCLLQNDCLLWNDCIFKLLFIAKLLFYNAELKTKVYRGSLKTFDSSLFF